ncbi:hypothetical protein WR25_26374 [Diploscapter pachys]|uniref:glucuronosyltransferase n=1 Tax=Diploscapter pachys TaxID=2018661 RepID=A0A2A2JHY5_9BILA|nr:hypothetical protein WR25_26374 [Diploscapter pachys]
MVRFLGIEHAVAWLTLLATQVSTLNVLVWSTTISQSHVNFMGSIADFLVEDGHNVTMMLLENDPDVVTPGTKLAQQVIWFSGPYVEPDEWYRISWKQGDVFNTRTINFLDFFRMEHINFKLCSGLLDDEVLLETLRRGKFDLVILEMFHFCPAGIFEIVGIPKVMITSALGMTYAHYKLLGMDFPLSYVPTQMTSHGTKMTFFERSYNVAFWYMSQFCYYYMMVYEQIIFYWRFGLGFPRLDKLYTEKMDYIMLNTNEFTESSRPTIPAVRHIGGATIPEPKPLGPEMESIMSKAKKGVVLFSLGSVVNGDKMPEDVRSAFLDAFRSFPDYQFVWKSSKNFQANFTHPNVHYQSWVPQVDLLADPRLKAFITHGGMNSILEALYFGVPLITLPVFGDQDSNSAVAAEHGYSYPLDKFTITAEKVKDALKAVLKDDKQIQNTYVQNAQHASRLLTGHIHRSREELLRLVRLSGSSPPLLHLRLNHGHLSLLQYYNVDVYLLGLIIAYGIFKLVKWIVHRYGRMKRRILATANSIKPPSYAHALKSSNCIKQKKH